MTGRWRFHLSGGSLCLDLANTLSWRLSDKPVERLHAYEDLVEWARQSGVLTAPEARALEHEARRRPVAAARMLARARALRETIYRVFSGLAGGRLAAHTDLSRLDHEFHDALKHLYFTWMRSRFVLAWPRRSGRLALPLWAVARSAVGTLTSADPRRLKTCPSSDCGWVFLDTSKSGTRRWCDMQVCGSRAKARRYYTRRRGRSAGGC